MEVSIAGFFLLSLIVALPVSWPSNIRVMMTSLESRHQMNWLWLVRLASEHETGTSLDHPRYIVSSRVLGCPADR